MKRILKKMLRSQIIQNFIAFLCFLYIVLIFRLTRWEKVNFEIPAAYVDKKRPFIVCFWHGRLMMMPYAWALKKKRPFHMLISGHRDGRLISKVISYLGIRTIEGSSTHMGETALKGMVRILKNQGTVGITPDGPKGPCHKAKMGLIMASYLTQADILPATFSVSSFKIFKSWDQFLWAFPSRKGLLVWGKPIKAPSNKSSDTFEKARVEVEKELINLMQHADEHLQFNLPGKFHGV